RWPAHPPEEGPPRFAPSSEAIAERVFGIGDRTLTVSNIDGLVPRMLSLGDRVQVASPASARDKVRGALERILLALQRPVEPEPEPARPPVQDERSEPRQSAEQDGKRERLRRLLLIVPAVRRRPGIKLPELALELGLEAPEMREGLDLLGLVSRP